MSKHNRRTDDVKGATDRQTLKRGGGWLQRMVMPLRLHVQTPEPNQSLFAAFLSKSMESPILSELHLQSLRLHSNAAVPANTAYTDLARYRRDTNGSARSD